MTSWDIIIDPPASGKENMLKDLRLFEDFEAGKIPPTLRIYSWKAPCVTVGYSQGEDCVFSATDKPLPYIKKGTWEVVKRPTGGGIVFHNTAEVTYSLVMDKNDPILPKGLIPAYSKISEAVVCALSKIGIDAEIRDSKFDSRNSRRHRTSDIGHRTQNVCFSWPQKYEIVYDNKKIVGSAQKRCKKALLQQGSIFVRNELGGELANQAISVEEILGRQIGFKELSDALVQGFKEVLGI